MSLFWYLEFSSNVNVTHEFELHNDWMKVWVCPERDLGHSNPTDCPVSVKSLWRSPVFWCWSWSVGLLAYMSLTAWPFTLCHHFHLGFLPLSTLKAVPFPPGNLPWKLFHSSTPDSSIPLRWLHFMIGRLRAFIPVCLYSRGHMYIYLLTQSCTGPRSLLELVSS